MRNDGGVSLAVINLCAPIKIRVATFDTDHSVTDHTDNQLLLQSRSFLILQSSQSAQLALTDDVSGETISLAISLKLVVDFH